LFIFIILLSSVLVTAVLLIAGWLNTKQNIEDSLKNIVHNITIEKIW